MGTESGAEEPGDLEMVKIDVKVTERQKKVIDRTWKERGYPNRSEFVRDVLRKATEPVLTEEALRELVAGMEDLKAGRTMGMSEVKSKFDIQ